MPIFLRNQVSGVTLNFFGGNVTLPYGTWVKVPSHTLENSHVQDAISDTRVAKHEGDSAPSGNTTDPILVPKEILTRAGLVSGVLTTDEATTPAGTEPVAAEAPKPGRKSTKVA